MWKRAALLFGVVAILVQTPADACPSVVRLVEVACDAAYQGRAIFLGTVTSSDVSGISYIHVDRLLTGEAPSDLLLRLDPGTNEEEQEFVRQLPNEQFLFIADIRGVEIVNENMRALPLEDFDVQQVLRLLDKYRSTGGTVLGWAGHQDGDFIGAPILIQGMGMHIQTTTDKEGWFFASGLRAGLYQISSPGSPALEENTVEVVQRGCARTFPRFVGAEISGFLRIQLEDGTLKFDEAAIVSAVPLRDGKPDTSLAIVPNEAPERGFAIKGLPPGQYLIGVNIATKPDENQHLPATYYPGVTEAEQAVPVTVSGGQRLEGLDLFVSNVTEPMEVRFVAPKSSEQEAEGDEEGLDEEGLQDVKFLVEKEGEKGAAEMVEPSDLEDDAVRYNLFAGKTYRVWPTLISPKGFQCFSPTSVTLKRTSEEVLTMELTPRSVVDCPDFSRSRPWRN